MWTAIATGVSWLLKLVGIVQEAKQTPEMVASKEAKTEQAVDEQSTKDVADAIKTGDVSKLRE